MKNDKGKVIKGILGCIVNKNDQGKTIKGILGCIVIETDKGHKEHINMHCELNLSLHENVPFDVMINL